MGGGVGPGRGAVVSEACMKVYINGKYVCDAEAIKMPEVEIDACDKDDVVFPLRFELEVTGSLEYVSPLLLPRSDPRLN